MPDGRRGVPRIRMPRISRPGRGSRAATEETTATETTATETTATETTATQPLTKPEETAKAGNGVEPAAKTPATEKTSATQEEATAKAGETPKTPEPNVQERIEGLQGWMAEIERKQGRITYFGGLALLLALGAAGAALYFGLTAHSDSATKEDLDALSTRVNSLQGAVTKNSKDTQNALNASIAQLQQSIGSLQKQQAQSAATISTLQSQVAAGALNNKTATTPGAAPAPGATTTTTPNAGANGNGP